MAKKSVCLTYLGSIITSIFEIVLYHNAVGHFRLPCNNSVNSCLLSMIRAVNDIYLFVFNPSHHLKKKTKYFHWTVLYCCVFNSILVRVHDRKTYHKHNLLQMLHGVKKNTVIKNVWSRLCNDSIDFSPRTYTHSNGRSPTQGVSCFLEMVVWLHLSFEDSCHPIIKYNV